MVQEPRKNSWVRWAVLEEGSETFGHQSGQHTVGWKKRNSTLLQAMES